MQYRALLGAVIVLCGCSFLIDAGADQCSRNSDCAQIGLPGVCERGVCVGQLASPARRPQDDAGAALCSGNDCESVPELVGVCTADSDCAQGEACFGQACASEAEVMPFICDAKPASTDETVHLSMMVREFVSQKPPVGLEVSACRKTDVTCSNELASFVDSDGSAVIELDLPRGFDGFLEVRSDDALTGLVYFTRPLEQSQLNRVLGVVAPTTLTLLASVSNTTVDPETGLVVMQAFDCMDVSVGGIHFEAGENSGTPFYIVDSAPSLESMVSVRDGSSGTAIGGFLNASPGFTIFSARIGVDGPLLGEFNALVRANAITYLDIYP
jgi:hypothetical protein